MKMIEKYEAELQSDSRVKCFCSAFLCDTLESQAAQTVKQEGGDHKSCTRSISSTSKSPRLSKRNGGLAIEAHAYKSIRGARGRSRQLHQSHVNLGKLRPFRHQDRSVGVLALVFHHNMEAAIVQYLDGILCRPCVRNLQWMITTEIVGNDLNRNLPLRQSPRPATPTSLPPTWGS